MVSPLLEAMRVRQANSALSSASVQLLDARLESGALDREESVRLPQPHMATSAPETMYMGCGNQLG